MLAQICLVMLVMTQANARYEYKFIHSSVPPTAEMQAALAANVWEDGYVPIWYRAVSPSYQNEWFRWVRITLPDIPADLNHDGDVNLRDVAILAGFYQGVPPASAKVSKAPPPPSRSRLEALADTMSELFMTERIE